MAEERQQQREDMSGQPDQLVVAPEPVLNPFQSEPFNLSFPELLKTVIMLPVFCLLLTALVFAYCSVRCALVGVTDPLYKPFSRWRRTLLWPLRLSARIAMLSFWISVKGRTAPRHEAPIVVANHVSFLDPVYIFFSHLSAKENANLPIVGLFLTALRIIPVDRAKRSSRKDAASQIRRRAIDNKWPHILIFPEGTTTNGKALIKTGAFSPCLPVQPMCIRYPHVNVSPAWANRTLPHLIFRLMTQVVNFMEVEYLPVEHPEDRDFKDPRLFAERVRQKMASALNVPCTEHSFLDMKLAVTAKRLHQPPQKLKKFSAMDTSHRYVVVTSRAFLVLNSTYLLFSGVLHTEDFVKALDLPLTPYTIQVFHQENSLDVVSFSAAKVHGRTGVPFPTHSFLVDYGGCILRL